MIPCALQDEMMQNFCLSLDLLVMNPMDDLFGCCASSSLDDVCIIWMGVGLVVERSLHISEDSIKGIELLFRERWFEPHEIDQRVFKYLMIRTLFDFDVVRH